MIATFTIKADAQKLCDKIHEYLCDNCKGYKETTVIWQEPRKHPTKNEWYVKLPAEYEKDFYPVKVKVKDHIDAEVKKAKKMVAKLDPDWKVAEVNPIKQL